MPVVEELEVYATIHKRLREQPGPDLIGDFAALAREPLQPYDASPHKVLMHAYQRAPKTRRLPAAEDTGFTPKRPTGAGVVEFDVGIGRYPVLVKEEEVALGKILIAGRQARARNALEEREADRIERRAIQDELAARQIMTLCNTRLVFSIANHYSKTPAMGLKDYCSEGVIGLMRAVDGYDYRKGFTCGQRG